MITEEQIKLWADRETLWLEGFNIQLEVNHYKGKRQYPSDDPFIYLFMQHLNSPCYVVFRMDRFMPWNDHTLEQVIRQLMEQLMGHRRQQIHKIANYLIPWGDSICG